MNSKDDPNLKPLQSDFEQSANKADGDAKTDLAEQLRFDGQDSAAEEDEDLVDFDASAHEDDTDSTTTPTREIPPVVRHPGWSHVFLIGMGIVGLLFVLSRIEWSGTPVIRGEPMHSNLQFAGHDPQNLAPHAVRASLLQRPSQTNSQHEIPAALVQDLKNAEVIRRQLDDERRAMQTTRLLASPVVQVSGVVKATTTADSDTNNATAMDLVKPSVLAVDANSAFQNSLLGQSKAQAVQLQNLAYTLLAGKMIPAILETAISSQLPGSVRSIVSMDVYGSQGRVVLIPRGSMLIGRFNAAVQHGQARIFIVWQRLVRPDGVAVNVDSAGTDPLGRAGLRARVNTHFWQSFGQGVMLSMISAGTLNIGRDDPQSLSNLYKQGIAASFQQSAQESLRGRANMAPTLMARQGDRVSILLQRDLDFTRVLAER